jgi:thiol-disulfide isomerase/thioredoxin
MILLLMLAALAQEPPTHAAIQVSLAVCEPGEGAGPRWSPKGESVPLTGTKDLLVGELALGPAGTPPVLVMLTRARESARVDQLAVDCDRNGAFEVSEVFTATPREQRGKWWSSFAATVQVPYGDALLPYPMALWFVEDPLEPDAPPMLRWSRKGWREGTFVLNGAPAHAFLSELHQDGVFDRRDAWFLAREREALYAPGARSLGQHTWLDGRAYRALSLSPDGLSLSLEAFDPGMTEAEERERADRLKPDREAKRAAAPLAFGHDLVAALAEAKRADKLVFVDFVTTWCGPCKEMDQLVYTAADVVAAASGVVAVKLDGDVERELVRRYEVKGYPTLLLLDADGNVLKRAIGYTSVAETVKLLAR